jgi:hypothetical protein
MGRYLVIMVCLAIVSSCAGDARPYRPSDGGNPQPDGSPVDILQFFDTGGGTQDIGTADTLRADQNQPRMDRGITPDQKAQSGPGGPCPCQTGSYCVNQVCRAACNEPTDICKASSNCQPNQACAQTARPGIWVCVPGVATGQPCDTQRICAVENVCAAVGSSTVSHCIATCAIQGISCGNGGTCQNAGNGCLLCVEP